MSHVFPRILPSFYSNIIFSSPLSPFAAIRCFLSRSHHALLCSSGVGDFNLMVDDDGAAYIIYTSHITLTHNMSVERLTDDYLATVPSSNSGCVLAFRVSAALLLFAALFALNHHITTTHCM
jgi:hypothetical protein